MKTLVTLLSTAILAIATIGTTLAQDHQHDEGMKGQMADMHQMMNDPEMKARMQKHLDMMQAMLNSEGMSQEEMQEMMSKPEMKSMMQKHMMCSKMMHAGKMGEHKKGTEHNHEGEDHSG